MLTEEIEDKSVSLTPGRAQPALGTKIIRNVMFGGLRYVLVAPIPFVMTPFILHKIGVAGYGTWAVFLAINGLTWVIYRSHKNRTGPELKADV